MDKPSQKQQILFGITLFSMFFGAGNLIFPPYLGYQAGQKALPAFLGFAASAVGLPILGVIAVVRTGGIRSLAGRVSGPFAAIYTMLIYLSIGPCLAIPRTASTSFEMAVTPFLPVHSGAFWVQVLYSAVFFGIALVLALHPTHLVNLLGKHLAPVLLALIAVLVLGGIFHGFSGSNVPVENYATVPAVQGFLDGYQTMDAIAALIFGMIFTLNIAGFGITEKKAVYDTALHSGGVAAILFATVYGALTWVGTAGAAGSKVENGAQALSYVAMRLFGWSGEIILAAIFFLACLNTCISLICCCGEYFHKLMPKMSYPVWASLFAAISAVIANAGLNAILKFSVPVLEGLYPMAIVLIALAFLPEQFHVHRPLLYPLSIALTGIVSVTDSLRDAGMTIPLFTDAVQRLPLSSFGLGWLVPALVGIAVGILTVRKQSLPISAA